MRVWKQTLIAIFCVCVLFVAGCGATEEEPFDAAAVDVILTTEPGDAEGETKLIAKLTGETFPEQTFIQFDIREESKPPVLLDGKLESDANDLYTTTYKFPEPGTYEVYMHLYIEEWHLMKRKQVDIE